MSHGWYFVLLKVALLVNGQSSDELCMLYLTVYVREYAYRPTAIHNKVIQSYNSQAHMYTSYHAVIYHREQMLD
jgi:hypothetical protein